MTPLEFSQLYHDWAFWARSDQAPPPGDWTIWFIPAGRGAGAEAVHHWVETYPIVNLIGATFADVRDTMITGESGILVRCRPDERPRFFAADLRLEWHGAVSWLFSAEEPDRLSGKQHMKPWCDELAAWREPNAFDQALLGLETRRQAAGGSHHHTAPDEDHQVTRRRRGTIVTRLDLSTTGSIWRGRSSNASPRATRSGRSGARS
jgi:phage terminase large subunit-like protein